MNETMTGVHKGMGDNGLKGKGGGVRLGTPYLYIRVPVHRLSLPKP